MKKEHLNTLKIASLTLMLGCFAVGSVYNHYQDKQQEHIIKVEKNNLQAQRQYASYNDAQYTITLSVAELSYQYENFYDVVNAENDWEYLTLTCNDITYVYDSNNSEDDLIIYRYSNELQIYFTYSDVYLGESSSFKFFEVSSDLPPIYPLSIIVNDMDINSGYENIKNAIELDIQANQSVNMGESIIGSIASGLGIIPNIAGEFLTGFSKLLWNNNQLTDFAIYSLVFLGIAITFAIVKLVLMIVRNNTGA